MALAALPTGACDDQGSAGGDGGPDGAADTDVDTDTDADAGPDGGDFVCEADPARVFDDVAYFASAELGGRKTGAEGNEAALVAAEELFAELGLEPIGDGGSYRQAFGFETTDYLAPPTVALDGETLLGGEDYTVFSGSGSAEVTEEVVYVGYGMTVPPYNPDDYPDCPLPSTGYDDYEGIDVTGKIALIVRHGPDDDATVPDTCPDNDLCGSEACLWNFTYKAANADLHGAAAMVLVQNYDNPADILAGASIADGYISGFAALWMNRDVVEAAIPDLQSWTDGIDAALAPDPHATGVEAALSVSMGVVEVATANVLGAIPGTDPELGDEVVVVGGHIDHLGDDCGLFPGADDNASGSAVTMELARLISECATPARTIIFALWNGEEEGLFGSIYYVQHPIYPLSSTIAAYSIDMVGVGDGSGIALGGTTDSQNSWLLDVMRGSAAEMGLDFDAVAMAPVSGSDHAPFDAVGVPAAMATTLGNHPYYHTPADTIDTITTADLEAAAALMYAGLRPLVEGTEEEYLDKGVGCAREPDPRTFDHPKRLARDR